MINGRHQPQNRVTVSKRHMPNPRRVPITSRHRPYDAGPDFDEADYGNDDLDKDDYSDEGIG